MKYGKSLSELSYSELLNQYSPVPRAARLLGRTLRDRRRARSASTDLCRLRKGYGEGWG